MMKKGLFFILFLFAILSVRAQVTTASLSGSVRDSQESIPLATVVATHLPSGSRYYSTSDLSGNFSIQGMRVGGPYTVEVSFIGYKTVKTEGINLRLGEDYNLKIKMEQSAQQLGEVVIQASKNPIINSNRTGASTNVGSRELRSLPSISRSLSDFTRLTPQASGSSFAGRDGRYNRVTIDGAAFNNNFGLNSDLMPGGGAQPISLEAIEEVSVNVAPYDVRMSQFTGASINAVTKSGDNEVKGVAYTYLRPKSFTGQYVGKDIVRNARESNTQIFGFSVGGPIIKDKLFYYVNAEYENTVTPSNSFNPSTDGIGNKQGKIARTTEDDLKKVKDHLVSKYGYDPGKYRDFDNFNTRNYKVLAKVDWNIDQNNKFSIRYNTLRNSYDQHPSPNSGPARIRSTDRNSENNVAFSNAYYGFINKVDAVSAELNTVISKQMSNRLLVSYTATSDARTSNSDVFPFVDILKGGVADAKGLQHYMSFGYELYSYNNLVKNNTFSIQDNLTYKLNQHTLTAGIAYDNIFLRNNFAQFGTSYYRYNSVEDFIDNKKPDVFAMTYGYNGQKPESVDLSFGLASAYLQDEYRVGDNLKITGGLRLDMPLYHNKLINNPAVDNIAAFGDYKLNVGEWPKPQIMVNPRIGFNWDVTGDRSIQVRGGTGLFTGVLPFVWFTNQPTNSAIYQNSIEISGDKIPDDFDFNKDAYDQIKKYPDLFPQTPPDKLKNVMLVEVSKKFKMPQIWRSNLAADFALPYNMILTLEGIISKDINAIVQRDLNMSDPTGNLTGPDNRPLWGTKKVGTKTVNDNIVDSNLRRVMLLDNSKLGYQSSFTAQLVKNFSNGLSGMLSYTYFNAKDVTANPGSRANSAFESNSTYTNLNSPELSYSQFAVPHRVVGSVSYRVEYAKNYATTISVFYTGAHQGRYTYLVNGDLNRDGIKSNDLIFVPNKASDLNFVDITKKDKEGVVTVFATAEEQIKAFDSYINEEPYLKKRKGNYAERNGGLRPWLNAFDIKVAQDIYTNFGTDKRYSLQLTLDINNVGNMLNKNWGVRKLNGLQDRYGNIVPLSLAKIDKDGVPHYTLNADNVAEFNKRKETINNVSISSTWGMMLGLRLLF